jgi:hypothetical protein
MEVVKLPKWGRRGKTVNQNKKFCFNETKLLQQWYPK